MTTLDSRARFNALPGSKSFYDFVASDIFQRAAESALVIMVQGHSANDLGAASGNALKMEGAKNFLNILMTLSDPLPEKPKTRPGQLNYT